VDWVNPLNVIAGPMTVVLEDSVVERDMIFVDTRPCCAVFCIGFINIADDQAVPTLIRFVLVIPVPIDVMPVFVV
jgi:hypothetical protein